MILTVGFRLATTSLVEKEVRPKQEDLINALYQNIPSGIGSTGSIKLSISEEKKVLTHGSRWAVQQGFGIDSDLDHTEDSGCMENADPDVVSNRALGKGEKTARNPSGRGITSLRLGW